jgi:hypothetical protein
LKTVQGLMSSTQAELVSLAKDFIAYRRLLQSDPEMALLRAVRIVGRGLTYMGQALRVASDEQNKQDIEAVLRRAKDKELLTTSDAAGIQSIIDQGKSISLDGLLFRSTSATEEVLAETVSVCSSPMAALLEAIRVIAQEPNQASIISAKMEIIPGSRATREMLQQAFLVGQRTFGENVMPDFLGMERMHRANPDIYNLLVESSTGLCVGYTSVVPLDQPGLEATLRKDFDHIPAEDILKYEFPGFYFVHLSSIAVDPAYRDLSQAYMMLTNSVFDKFLELANNAIYIAGMSADAITTNGHRICKSLGMEAVEHRDGGSTLFYGCLLPPKIRLSSKSGAQLLKVYKTAYAELKDVCPSIQFPLQ